ncbi:MAG: heme ABC exporter ATP-binding protein CcmA [Acidimicrobiia bacterium]
MTNIVELRKTAVSLGGRRVLADIDLTLAPGESLGIAGPNGSGKTTLVRTIATLISIDGGEAHVLGANTASADLTGIRSQIGLIGHQPSLIDELTLLENLEHVARLAEIEPRRVGRALDVVGLAGAAERRASACSFGMKRRVEIAHLLLTRPRLLLLDEAASGLDSSARELIETLVESVRERQGAVVMVSHDQAQLAVLCNAVANLASGRLETSG